MKFTQTSEHVLKRAEREHWKVQSVIVLKDGTKILSSNTKEFEEEYIRTSSGANGRIVINPGWNPKHPDMHKWARGELDNDEIDHVEEYTN